MTGGEQLEIVERFAVHCFFGCPHVERDSDPDEAGRRMNDHYENDHARQLSEWS